MVECYQSRYMYILSTTQLLINKLKHWPSPIVLLFSQSANDKSRRIWNLCHMMLSRCYLSRISFSSPIPRKKVCHMMRYLFGTHIFCSQHVSTSIPAMRIQVSNISPHLFVIAFISWHVEQFSTFFHIQIIYPYTFILYYYSFCGNGNDNDSCWRLPSFIYGSASHDTFWVWAIIRRRPTVPKSRWWERTACSWGVRNNIQPSRVRSNYILSDCEVWIHSTTW